METINTHIRVFIFRIAEFCKRIAEFCQLIDEFLSAHSRKNWKLKSVCVKMESRKGQLSINLNFQVSAHRNDTFLYHNIGNLKPVIKFSLTLIQSAVCCCVLGVKCVWCRRLIGR